MRDDGRTWRVCMDKDGTCAGGSFLSDTEWAETHMRKPLVHLALRSFIGSVRLCRRAR